MKHSRSTSFLATPGGITLTYLLLGLLWVFASDQLLLLLSLNQQETTGLQTIKGAAWILATAALIYVLIRRSWKSLREANRRLQEEQALNESIFSALPDTFYAFNRRGDILRWNRRVTEVTGYTDEEVAAMQPLDFIPERYHDRLTNHIETIFDEHEPVTTEAAYLTKDNHEVPYEFTASELKDDSGEVLGLVGIGRDITARKAHEEALRQEKERFQLLVEEVKDYAIFMLNPEGNIISWNKGAENIKGYSEQEILGRHFSTFYMQEDMERGLPDQLLEQARQCGRTASEGWRVRKDGSRFWARVSITALHDETGELRGFVKVTRDLTEERERERRFRAIFNQTFQFIGLMKPDGTLIEANETALDFGGLQREEVVGKPVWDTPWMNFSEKTRQAVREAAERAAAGEFVRREINIQGKHQVATVDFSIKPVLNEEGKVILLIPEGRNITERKRLEQENEEVRQQERQWFAQELHDGICQQLSNLSIMAATLKIHLQELPSQVAERIEQIAELTNRTIKEARALSHGIAPVDFEEEDFVDVLGQLIREMERAHRITCTFEVDDDLTVDDVAVATNLYRIAQEALINAVRHGKASHIGITLTHRGDEIVLQIEDDGIGIEEKPQGGIGMQNMQRRARIIKGRLDVGPGSQSGTIVQCTVPLRQKVATH